jgi:putative SOS response-associated peptidase YedK
MAFTVRYHQNAFVDCSILPYPNPVCGRYRLSRNGKQVAEEFAVEEGIEWYPRYNIAPTDQVPTIRQDRSEPIRHLALMRWGLIPFWANDASIGAKTINAMSETAATKPAFREAMKMRRCLIPADSFYEWVLGPKQRQPYSFGMADDSIFAFAGLWERWKDTTGQQILSCTILTTSPNTLLAEVHDRMPAILRPDDYDLWLDPGITDPARVVHLLTPFEAKLMKKYPVSTRVNSVKNDDAECAREIKSTSAEAQGRLFTA